MPCRRVTRQGIRVLLLEAHDTFDREFRGDSVHPSTRELIEQLGLTDQLVKLAEARVADFPLHTPDGRILSQPHPILPTRFPETLQVFQAALLEMFASAAQRYPSFEIETGARVEQLIETDGVVSGVRYRNRAGLQTVHATLVVGADGRFSKVRQLAGMAIHESSQAIDVLWLRLPKFATDSPHALGISPGATELLIVGDRGTWWQISLAFPKGGYQALREEGIDALRRRIARLGPWLADRVDSLEDWNQTSLLVVRAGLVRRWYRPGLLLIGDAAHVMSPVYGVGINYAVQDAIVAANTLGPRLRDGTVRNADMAAVQRRREWPTRLMQLVQRHGEYQALSGPAPRGARLVAWLMQFGRCVRCRRGLSRSGVPARAHQCGGSVAG